MTRFTTGYESTGEERTGVPQSAAGSLESQQTIVKSLAAQSSVNDVILPTAQSSVGDVISPVTQFSVSDVTSLASGQSSGTSPGGQFRQDNAQQSSPLFDGVEIYSIKTTVPSFRSDAVGSTTNIKQLSSSEPHLQNAADRSANGYDVEDILRLQSLQANNGQSFMREEQTQQARAHDASPSLDGINSFVGEMTTIAAELSKFAPGIEELLINKDIDIPTITSPFNQLETLTGEKNEAGIVSPTTTTDFPEEPISKVSESISLPTIIGSASSSLPNENNFVQDDRKQHQQLAVRENEQFSNEQSSLSEDGTDIPANKDQDEIEEENEDDVDDEGVQDVTTDGVINHELASLDISQSEVEPSLEISNDISDESVRLLNVQNNSVDSTNTDDVDDTAQTDHSGGNENTRPTNMAVIETLTYNADEKLGEAYATEDSFKFKDQIEQNSEDVDDGREDKDNEQYDNIGDDNETEDVEILNILKQLNKSEEPVADNSAKSESHSLADENDLDEINFTRDEDLPVASALTFSRQANAVAPRSDDSNFESIVPNERSKNRSTKVLNDVNPLTTNDIANKLFTDGQSQIKDAQSIQIPSQSPLGAMSNFPVESQRLSFGTESQPIIDYELSARTPSRKNILPSGKAIADSKQLLIDTTVPGSLYNKYLLDLPMATVLRGRLSIRYP